MKRTLKAGALKPEELMRSGRKNARHVLAKLLDDADRLRAITNPSDGISYVMRGDHEVMAQFSLRELESDLSPANFALVRTLFRALQDRCMLADYAVAVARVELSTATKRKSAGDHEAGKRKLEATNRDAALAKAAKSLLAKNHRLTDSDVARQLSERGHGGAESIRKKLPRLLRG